MRIESGVEAARCLTASVSQLQGVLSNLAAVAEYAEKTSPGNALAEELRVCHASLSSVKAALPRIAGDIRVAVGR